MPRRRSDDSRYRSEKTYRRVSTIGPPLGRQSPKRSRSVVFIKQR